MSPNGDQNTLFSKMRWFSVEESQKQKLKEEVAGMDGNRLLNTSVDDLCKYLCERYEVDVPVLSVDQIVVDQRETQIDVSRESNRFFSDPGRQHVITGTEVEVSIPFSGEEVAFQIRPTQYTLNPARARVKNGHIYLTVSGVQLQTEAVRNEIDRAVKHIEETLRTLRENASVLVRELPAIARTAVEERRQKLLANSTARLSFLT